ncbi:hypothetical protein AVEN_151212-1, partial [Araneus ventricosus]
MAWRCKNICFGCTVSILLLPCARNAYDISMNSSDAIQSTDPNEQANYFIEEYMWSLLIVMEQYLSQHCRSFSDEVKRISLKWNNALQIGNLLRLGAKT